MACIVPIIKCRDIEAASEFYTRVIGAALQWTYSASEHDINPSYRSIMLYGEQIHLSSFPGDGVFGSATCIYVKEVDTLAARLAEIAPQCIRLAPTDQTWGQRELYVEDPDGNVLRFSASVGD